MDTIHTCTNAPQGEPQGEPLTLKKLLTLMDGMPRRAGYVLLTATPYVESAYKMPAPDGSKALWWLVAPKKSIDDLVAEYGPLRPSRDMPNSYEVDVFEKGCSEDSAP